MTLANDNSLINEMVMYVSKMKCQDEMYVKVTDIKWFMALAKYEYEMRKLG